MWRVIAIFAFLFSGYAGAQSVLTERLRATRGNANVRVRPSLDAEVISLIAHDNEVHVDSAGRMWSRVRLPHGATGYIASRLLGPSQQPGEWRTLLYISAGVCVASILAALAARRRSGAGAIPAANAVS
jgi:hypothetical protein